MKTIYLLLVPFFAFANFEIIPNQVSPSNISSTAVSVRATMNSDGSVSGDIYLWYGEGDFLSSFQYIGISAPAGPGITINGVTIGASLSDLSPNTQYSFRWIVANSTGSMIYFSDQTTFITGSSSNSTPTDIFISSSEISEDSEVGSVVGSLSTSDIDSGDQFTYSLVSGDGDSGNSNFSIEGNNLLTASTLDAEITPSYSIRIQTDDANGGVFSKSFNISITTGEDPSDNSLPTYVPTNGLVAYYPFNGGADDASVNTNNGSVNGAILSEDRNGNPNSCYYFDGQDDYIDMGSGESLKIQNSFSTSVWFKAMGGGCNPRIFEYINNSSSGGGYVLALTTGTQLKVAHFGANNEENGFFDIDNFFNQNTWTHIAFTVEGATGQAKLYLNGELFLDQPNINNIQTQQINYNGSLHVGNINPFRCDWFEGNIDDLGLWNRVLSSEEISQLFNSQTDSNSTPTDIFISSSEISEDSEVGSVVGSLSTSDIDSGDQFTYSLVSGDGDSGNSNFSIEGNNLLTASTLDAEITPSYSIRIQTDDGNGGVFSKSFNISITTGEDPSDNSLPTYVPTNGLVAYYPFNGSANDETGNGYDGIINGAVLTSDRFGNNEKAYNYNGTDTFITLPNDFFNGAENGSYTINLWTKHVSTQVPIFKKGGSWKESFVYISPDDKVQYSFYNGTNSDLNVLESNISLDLNNWYNICITHADDEIKLYINGILDSQLQTSNVVDWSTSINTPCSGSGMYIGKDFNNCTIDRGFYGVIDDFGIWNRALTQQEVTNLFNSDTTLSTTDFLNSIIMYPNPVKNMLTIDGFVVKDFVIYSVLGKVVLKMSNQNTIDVSSLSKGVYFIKVSDGINGSTKKFIKE